MAIGLSLAVGGCASIRERNHLNYEAVIPGHAVLIEANDLMNLPMIAGTLHRKGYRVVIDAKIVEAQLRDEIRRLELNRSSLLAGKGGNPGLPNVVFYPDKKNLRPFTLEEVSRRGDIITSNRHIAYYQQALAEKRIDTHYLNPPNWSRRDYPRDPSNVIVDVGSRSDLPGVPVIRVYTKQRAGPLYSSASGVSGGGGNSQTIRCFENGRLLWKRDCQISFPNQYIQGSSPQALVDRCVLSAFYSIPAYAESTNGPGLQRVGE